MSRRGHGDYTPLQQHASAIDDEDVDDGHILVVDGGWTAGYTRDF